MNKLTEDEWYELFTPVKNHIEDYAAFDGCLFETYGAEAEYITQMAEADERKVWTVIEEDGILYLVNGVRFVNRLGYIITEESWTTDTEVRYDQVEDFEEQPAG